MAQEIPTQVQTAHEIYAFPNKTSNFPTTYSLYS